MVLKASIFSLLWMSVINAQTEINFSYEMKYGDGKQVTPFTQDTTDYSYFENLLDINTYYGDKIYIYSQLEYSNPPVYGNNRTSIDSILNTFYIEYLSDRYNIKLGDLYELYGRGLGFYTLQEQTIDYNNSIRGLTLNYFLKENLKVSTIIGTGEYDYRSNPAKRESDLQINNNIILGSLDYEHNNFGYFQFLYLKQTTLLTPEFIDKIYNKGEIGTELDKSQRTPSEQMQYMFNQSNPGAGISDTLNPSVANYNWNFYFGPIEVYIDKVWMNYEKIYGNEVFGSRFYSSIYTELFETGITYEYKDYYTPYLIKSISNPPIVYREGNSILASRNVHSMNFGNEVGHQIDLNRNLFGDMNVTANLSISNRHQIDEMESISLLDVLLMKDEDKMYAYYPFRQVYLEINRWTLSERLYYKVGMDYFTEFYDGKNTSALTIPTHWVWKLSSTNSLTIYLETQKKNVKKITPGEYTNHYSSISYSHLGEWVLTGFYDQEISKGKTRQWPGFDFSYYLNSSTQISLFYGSQKGGLICANGICAEQPGFEDGVKITFRSLF